MTSSNLSVLRVLRYVLAWPRFLGWAFPLLAVVLFFARDLRLASDAVLTATWRPWFGRRWRYSTTLAAGMIMHPAVMEGPSSSFDETLRHELVHLRQAEDLALAGAILAPVLVALSGSWLMLLVWPGMLLVQLSGYLGSVLRGGDPYRDAEHERAARAWAEESRSR